ncbi:MAG TPA: malonyl-CoA decarboxylase [Alphaproteobacteria bacterium]|nr:malonyl-CoA decarboxylase [Alphaproteobacteria bacterium]
MSEIRLPETRSATASLFDRTLRNLRDAWRDISQTARGAIGGAAPGVAPDLPDGDIEQVRRRMHDCLEARGGEVSARVRAAELGRLYLGLGADGRRRFLRLLAEEFDVDHGAVQAAAAALLAAKDDRARAKAERELRAALQAPRVRLLTQFNGLPEGVKFLVDLRAELIRLAREDRKLAGVERDLKDLLVAWFDIGFLELQRITWDAPAALLEKLSVYEAVHQVRSWVDLKNRLDSDRRCFAFFHPRMPSEPLIFVEVALVTGMAGNIQALLDAKAPVADPRNADTAIFYSISNAQKGLAGVSFGGFLIKRVADQLAGEFPRLKAFATLSPIPGFRAWLDQQFSEGLPGVLDKNDRKALATALGESNVNKGAVKQVLADNSWLKDPALTKALEGPLLRLCARYLAEAKREDGKALDPVANFHLSNGARIERINWLGDTSKKGLQQSAGLMVNYQYRLDDIEENHEAYEGEGKVAMSSAVAKLLK